MGGQSWLSDTLAGVMILTTIYCITRVAITRTQRRPAEYDVDVVHALMGVAMAGMLVTSLKTLPADAWAVVFAAAAAWYAWQITRGYRASRAGEGPESEIARQHRHHHLPHLAMCAAMVYMLLAVPAAMGSGDGVSGAMGMGGSSSGSRFPLLALVLTLILVGFVAWDTDRLSRLPRLAAAQATATRVEAGLAAARAGVLASIGSGQASEAAVTGQTLVAAAVASPGQAEMLVAPRLALCCQVAMGATMAYMLVLML